MQGNTIENDPLTLLIKNPNPQQAQFEFLYNHLVYKSLGNNYIDVKSSTEDPRNINSTVALFNLNQDYIDFSNIENFKRGFVFADSDVEELGEVTIEYTLKNVSVPIPVKNLIVYNDLPNGLKNNNLIRGCSRVDSLIPALSNISEGQRSKNINLNMAGTFVTSNEKTAQGMNTPINPDEQREIEEKILAKNIIASKTSLRGFRMAEDLDEMVFDEQFASDVMKVAQGYGMDKGVMNFNIKNSALGDDNNDKAVAQWIQNDIQFEGKIFASTLEAYYNYEAQGKKVHMTFDHLPAMQIIEKERAEKMKLKADTLKILVDSGIELEDAKMLLNIDTNENVRQ